MLYDVFSMLWVKFGIDLFEYCFYYYLLVVDYFSKFFIVKKLFNQMLGYVIGFFKIIFVEYGILIIVYID